MPKPNNPYRRPIDATKESAQTIGEYYGTPATDKAINHAAGGRNVSPASRYQAVGNSNSPTTAAPKKVKAKPHSPGNGDATAEELFQW
jgi:hypothetical protein